MFDKKYSYRNGRFRSIKKVFLGGLSNKVFKGFTIHYISKKILT